KDRPQGSSERSVFLVVEERELEPLNDHEGVGAQSRPKVLIEFPRVEPLGGPVVEHVYDVDDDDVVASIVRLDELASVFEEQANTRVVECAAVPADEVFAAELHQLGIQVHHRRRPDGAVNQNLSERRALTAAD